MGGTCSMYWAEERCT